MLDFYVGGLSDAFVSVLDTSFVGAVLLRSLTCCGAVRGAASMVHFSAASSAESGRDSPMHHVDFLRVLMHEPLPPTALPIHVES